MSDQETIDRLTREFAEKHETLMLYLMACGMGRVDAEAHVQGIIKRWKEEHGYGDTPVQWTSVRPTEPGRYWCLHRKGFVHFQMVSIDSLGHCWSSGMSVDGILSDVLWWPIPIEPPPMPAETEPLT